MLVACNAGAPDAKRHAASDAEPDSARPAAATIVPDRDAASLRDPTSDAVTDAARRIAGTILIGGDATKTLTALTDSHGSRMTGTAGYDAAAAWAVERFRRSGIDVALAPFTLDRTWVPGEAHGRIDAPMQRELHVASLALTPGTPEGGIRGQVVKIDDVSEHAIAALKGSLDGKIVYLSRGHLWQYWATHPVDRLLRAGAAAVLVGGGSTNNALDRILCRGPKQTPCSGPAFVVGREDAAYLVRLLEQGSVTVQLHSSAALGTSLDVPNVVAEIAGRESPDEVVALGAHLDAWDVATGAQDDGSGVVQVLEAARAIRTLGAAPRRTLRFFLWGGEEQDMLGSRAYATAHAAEMDHIVVYLNADYGGGAPVGWQAGGGREDITTALRPIAQSLLSGLGADHVESSLVCDTDDCPFWARGVPTLNLKVDMSDYMSIHHLPSDTVDKVKPAALASGAAVMAITAYALAELPQRVASRDQRTTMAKRLAGKDVLDELIDKGLWSR
jgi:hypothetical protein